MLEHPADLSEDFHKLGLLFLQEVNFGVAGQLESLYETGVFYETHSVESLDFEGGVPATFVAFAAPHACAQDDHDRPRRLSLSDLLVRKQEVLIPSNFEDIPEVFQVLAPLEHPSHLRLNLGHHARLLLKKAF